MSKERRLGSAVRKADKIDRLPKVRERGRLRGTKFETIVEIAGGFCLWGSVTVSPAMLIAEHFASNSFDRDRNAFIVDYPQLPLNVLTDAAEYDALRAQPKRGFIEPMPYNDPLTEKEDLGADLEEVRNRVNSLFENTELERRLEELKEAHDEFVIWKSDRDDAVTKAVGDSKSDNFAEIALLFPLATFIAGVSLVTKSNINILRDRGGNLRSLTDFIKNEKPEWVDTPPSSQEIADFVNKATMLPPIGSKLVLLKTNNKHTVSLFNPSQMSDRMTERVSSSAQSISEGLETENAGMVHQMTVQGRLPDEFKYAAVSLLAISPFETNWKDGVFYHSPWGKNGPLIHDGGNFDTRVNSRWRGVDGRTDYLHRLYVPGMGDIEKKRLIDEMRFYQRAAFALHCKTGTAPRSISEEVKQQSGDAWDKFKDRIHGALAEYELEGVVGTPWFLDKPRILPDWPGERYEADWPDIQNQLIKLEEVRPNHPDLLNRVRDAMSKLSDRIDEIIESS